MRLTADLILTAPSYLNPLKDRELDLRGHKIAVIENLGVTQDQFDTIDLSDNEIQLLENFPLLQRLKTLMLNNNRVFCLASSGLGESLPKLETLILTNNKLEKLEDLEALAQLAPSLRELSLLGNPVTRRPNYRLYLIAKLPRLKVLDFTRVKPQEKQEAKRLFLQQTSTDKTFTPGEDSTKVGQKRSRGKEKEEEEEEEEED